MNSSRAAWPARLPPAALIVYAILAGIPPAGAADLSTPLPAKPVFKAPPARPGGSFWVGAEYLLWSTKGDHLPALVTASPPGTPLAQAGVLGAPGTSVLFGNDGLTDDWRSGARVRAGYWFDPQRNSGIEAQFFILGGGATSFAATSTGNPLGLPFVDATTGLPAAFVVAFPGQPSGSVAIEDSSHLLGAGIDYRHELCGNCALGSLSGLVGYRFVRLRDSLGIDAATVSTAALAVPVSTAVSTADQFETVNDFHGLDLGPHRRRRSRLLDPDVAR